MPDNKPLSPLGAAALDYARRGLAVFPLKPREKIPITPHGVKDATTDAERIVEWWRECPDANIGCATGEASGLWTADVDGEPGERTIAALQEANGPLSDDAVLLTGRGRQLLFRYTEPIRNSVGKLGAGLDVRGDGGYTILPPAFTPTAPAIAGPMAPASPARRSRRCGMAMAWTPA